MKMQALLALALCAAGPALAQGQSAPGSAAAYRCGGVGNEDQQSMKAQAANHDLLVTFALSSGAYVSNVDVRITSAAGAPVLQVRCGGPLMLVDLPGAGRYEVEASFEGKSQRKSVTVGEPSRSLVFTWPAS